MSVANVEYHVVRPIDEAAYKQFMTDLFAEGLSVLPDRGTEPTDEQWAEFFKRRRSEHFVLFIAEHEGRLIGGGGVGRIEQPNREHSVSLALNVSKEYRNQGVGRALLRHTLRWASAAPAVERQLGRVAQQSRATLEDLISRTKRILTQKQRDKNKLYALHAPEVECLAKGKARKPYEFGVKVSITTTHKEGLVVGARSMPGNPYDGHTLAEALEQAAILSDVQPEIAVVDRGYKGVAVDGVKVYHPACDAASRAGCGR